VRGAVNGLTAELLEDHIRPHVVDPAHEQDSEKAKVAPDLIEVVRAYLKGLIRDTGTILLYMNPDRKMADNLKRSIENDGDHVVDLHLCRLGPSHLGAIASVETARQRKKQFYRAKVARFRSLSLLTIEVKHIDPPVQAAA
jgi:hypothetical protein